MDLVFKCVPLNLSGKDSCSNPSQRIHVFVCVCDPEVQRRVVDDVGGGGGGS